MLHRLALPSRLGVLLLLLSAGVTALPHGDEHGSTSMHHGGMSPAHGLHTNKTTETAEIAGPISYFAHGEHVGTILAHIVLMVLAWFFILPIGMKRKQLMALLIYANIIRDYRCNVQYCPLSARPPGSIPLPNRQCPWSVRGNHLQ